MTLEESPKKTVVIEFTDNDAGARRALNADIAYSALSDIGDEIFRPARKHGYPSKRISALIQKMDTHLEEKDPSGELTCQALIGLLEDRFHEILEESGIDLDRDLR